MNDDEDLGTPRDSGAERLVLGACMESAQAYRGVAEILSGADFYEPRHATIWAVIVECHTVHGLADPVLVADALRESGQIAKVGGVGYLHTLYSQAPLSGMAVEHSRIIADLATRRRLLRAGQKIVQRAESGIGEVVDLIESAATDIRAARDTRVGVELLTESVGEFMDAQLEEPDWVVPSLLARGDRFILTGAGGLGKSTLLRQIAVCAAAGIPPLDWSSEDTYEPAKVAIFDCENADHQLKTSLWPMLRQVRDTGCDVEDRLRIGGHGNPLNLLDQTTAMSLLRTIEHDKPDLVYIGPVYKLHNDDPDKEVVIKKITSVLDQIRATGAALIAEAHHTKASKQGGSLEPSGSNVWTWWPEIGRGLRLDPDSDSTIRRCALEHWRIDRVHRRWPAWIEAGGAWPWAASRPNPHYGGIA